MMWSYVTFPDGTQIAYSDIRKDGTVYVRAERPIDMGFDSASCVLPACRWGEVKGFSGAEIKKLDAFIRNNSSLILELAQRHDAEGSNKKCLNTVYQF